MSLSVGDIIQDKYRIVRLIGEGGMGAVYEGENTLIARRVAIKVLLNSAAVNPEIVQRFQREAQAAGRIGNDHILEVLDLGTLPDGDLLMVMEYLDGENLADRIDRLGRLTPQQVYPVARQLLEGLGAAHAAGIIHRDLKPENVFILKEKAGHSDFVKIIDFGISKFNVMDGNMQMTATGAVMGTPYYMAPEQAKGVKVADPRSDIYAVGVILYKAITGAEPFSAETFNELLFKIVLSELVPAKRLVAELDPAFDTIICKAMAKDPDYRFASCEDLARALDSWAQSGAAVTVPPPPATDDPAVLAGVAPALSETNRSHAASQAGVPARAQSVSEAQAPDTPEDQAASDEQLSVPTTPGVGVFAGVAALALVVVGTAGWGVFRLFESEADSANQSGPHVVAEPTASTPGSESAEPERTAVKSGTDDQQPDSKPVSVQPVNSPDPSGQEAGAEPPDGAHKKTGRDDG